MAFTVLSKEVCESEGFVGRFLMRVGIDLVVVIEVT